MKHHQVITGHDCSILSLLIDTQSPIDVLHNAATYRIRDVTQLLENFAISDKALQGQWCYWNCRWCSAFCCEMGVIL